MELAEERTCTGGVGGGCRAGGVLSALARYRVNVEIEGAIGLRLPRACEVAIRVAADSSSDGQEMLSLGNAGFDPYCVCEVPSKPRSRVLTTIAKRTCEPVWNCKAEIEDFALGDPINFSVFGRVAWSGKDELLGHGQLSGSDLLAFTSGAELPLREPGLDNHSSSSATSNGLERPNASLRIRISVRRDDLAWATPPLGPYMEPQTMQEEKCLPWQSSSDPTDGGLSAPQQQQQRQLASASCLTAAATSSAALAATARMQQQDASALLAAAREEERRRLQGWYGSEDAKANPLGATAPAVTPPLEVDAAVGAHHYDGEVLFQMLDTDADGLLGRREARTWLRSLGWCLDDPALDTILNEVLPSPESEPRLGKEEHITAHTPFVASSSHQSSWQFPDLFAVAERNRELCGPDTQAIRNAFRLLAGTAHRGGFDENAVSRDALKVAATRYQKEGGLSEADFDDLIDFCGVSLMSRFLNLDAMTDSIVETICHPRVATRPTRPFNVPRSSRGTDRRPH